MKQVIVLLLLSHFLTIQCQWNVSPLNTNAPKKIIELAAQSGNNVWVVVQKEMDELQLHFWNGTTWSAITQVIKSPIQKFDIINNLPTMLSSPAQSPQSVSILKNGSFITQHTFSTQTPVLNIIEYRSTLLALENSAIQPIGQLPDSLKNLTTLSNISDWTTDALGRLWLIKKTLVGQGRQTTLFIKLKYWDDQTKTVKQVAQQMGPRIFKLSGGQGQTIWSVQGDAPTQLYAYQWDNQANKWNLKGSIKGFKSIDVTPDGTVFGLHHNNTIYEWQDN